MAQQVLEAGGAAPIVIETPCGYITIEKESATNSKPRFVITVPDACNVVANRGWKRATSRWVERGEDGVTKPRYRMLVPVTDAEGALVDLEEPKVVRIERKRAGASHEPVSDAVANGTDHSSGGRVHDTGHARVPAGAH